MTFNNFNSNIITDIELVLGFKIKDKRRLYNGLLSNEYLYKEGKDDIIEYNKYLRKLGESLIDLIKVDYIFNNITIDFNTLKFINTRTKKTIRNNINFNSSILHYINRHGEKDIYNNNSYDTLNTLLGIIYIEKDFEVAKKLIITDVIKLIEDFIKEPKYDWSRIIKEWGKDNNIKSRFDFIESGIKDDLKMFKVKLNILDKETIGYESSMKEARIDAAYKYFKKHLVKSDIEDYIIGLKFEGLGSNNHKLPFIRQSELENIKSFEVDDYWMLNECFIHDSYIQENKDSKYRSNEAISYLGNYVRYLIIDKFIYENRIIFNKEFHNLNTKTRKKMVNSNVNIDLFKKENFNQYILMSDTSKEIYNVVNGMANNTINSLLGTIFLSNNNSAHKFVDIYINHLLTYLPRVDKNIKRFDEDEEKKYELTNNKEESLTNYNNEDYSHLLNPDISTSFIILEGQDSVDQQINYLAKEIEIINMYITCGFVYKSGLALLQNIIKTIHDNSGNIEMIIGSLERYNEYKDRKSSKVIMGMDKSTANYINLLIKERDIKIKTFEKSFYHGKFYMLEGKERSCFIIGSSNVSESAFNLNRELNILYIVNNNSDEYNYFQKWYNNLALESVYLEELDEAYFSDSEITYINNYSISTIKETEFINQINELTDEEIKFRMNLWMNKKPDLIYNELDIDNLEGYYLFKYNEYNLLVLESFEPQNAFYCFKNWNIEELLSRIKHLSKTEIFEISGMDKRGYHISDRNKLEVNVNMYFIKRYY